MSLHAVACAIAAAWTAVNRKPLTILAFVPVCLAFIGVGWTLGQTELFLLIVTTALSVDASLSARMVMLKQAQDNGDEPVP